MVEWQVHEFDIINYQKGLDLQMKFWKDAQKEKIHHLMLLEHEPVITLGRRTKPDHIIMDEEEIRRNGIDVFKVERGGSATYHGPGQLVGYIICKSSRLGGIHDVVSRVLNAVKQIIENFGVEVDVDHDNPGVWTISKTPRKLAAVGMQNKLGYTLHGFAINVNLPLTGFQAIVPCGLTLPVSTMSIESGKIIDIKAVKSVAKDILLSELGKKV